MKNEKEGAGFQGSGVGNETSGIGKIRELKSYRDLQVWQKAMNLVLSCYQATRNFPRHETFGLAQQVRRASVSIPSNIAEGHSRQHTKQFLEFLAIAYGSLAEFETQMELSNSLGYLQPRDYTKIIEDAGMLGKLINGLSRALKRRLCSAP